MIRLRESQQIFPEDEESNFHDLPLNIQQTTSVGEEKYDGGAGGLEALKGNSSSVIESMERKLSIGSPDIYRATFK